MSNSTDASLGHGTGDAPEVDKGRRTVLIATCAAGGAATAATAWPFLSSLQPSERAKAAGAPVEADVSKLEPGQMTIVEWRGKPIWILRRTKEMLASLDTDTARLADPHSEKKQQPPYATNEARSINPEYLVLIGICTHLGCSPTPHFQPADPALGDKWPGGFFCPCHGSRFDLAGRVFANMPAPENLVVPPYKFLSATSILIGDDSKEA
jgi:ubiquinol-cytochrome c reductase iron-sulfur subunit